MVAKATGDHLRMGKLSNAPPAPDPELEAKQLASAIITLLDARDVEINGVDRAKIEECKDLGKLKKWLIQAAKAKTPEALFANRG